jgi:hypothetical protein
MPRLGLKTGAGMPRIHKLAILHESPLAMPNVFALNPRAVRFQDNRRVVASG